MESCPICEGKITTRRNETKYFVECPRCGNYTIEESIVEDRSKFENISKRTRTNASAWIRENKRTFITENNFDFLFNLRTPSFHERADKLLLSLEKDTEYAGHLINFNCNTDVIWQSRSWCINTDELYEIIRFLMEMKRVNCDMMIGGGVRLAIAPEGWAHIETLKKYNPNSHQGFVAMWFNEEVDKIYSDVIAPAIENAGYTPHRVDRREYNDRIDDEIILQIRRSRFVVADFTGQRGGVYYEAGFAKGLGMEVFWTCRADEEDKLHFDIRQYNCILWSPDDLDDFRSRLAKRIEAVLGRGGSIKNV